MGPRTCLCILEKRESIASNEIRTPDLPAPNVVAKWTVPPRLFGCTDGKSMNRYAWFNDGDTFRVMRR